MAEGLQHHEYQCVIALNLGGDFCEDNEEAVIRVILQPMSHVPNVIFSQCFKSLLVPYDGTNI